MNCQTLLVFVLAVLIAAAAVVRVDAATTSAKPATDTAGETSLFGRLKKGITNAWGQVTGSGPKHAGTIVRTLFFVYPAEFLTCPFDSLIY